ncbi:MAG TPA: DUF2321 domain-containing protein [Gemmataceae bacterium]|nr:DUF2321 domain-containing protein [Gemmataceae bacterium]
MSAAPDDFQDVMLVCRNGHVLTDRLRTSPDRELSHCDRCGATTLSCCPTCGHELPGAKIIPGMSLVGVRTAPEHCPSCGVAFPWTARPAESRPDLVRLLEPLLRRLPRVVRQLRTRHGERPPFRVQDEHDLADLLRALLTLAFDDVRPESRTPRYASTTRTDFLMTEPTAGEQLALVIKQVGSDVGNIGLPEQVREDAAYYAAQPRVRQMVVLIHDPEGRTPNPQATEKALASQPDGPPTCCFIVT